MNAPWPMILTINDPNRQAVLLSNITLCASVFKQTLERRPLITGDLQ